MKSAFDDEESYELPELGSQFVHYVLTDVVTRIRDGTGPGQHYVRVLKTPMRAFFQLYLFPAQNG